MAGQENGWPLGLHLRMRNRRFTESVSFNTELFTASPTPTSTFSSDLDTQSTGSFFGDKSVITLGSLIGISNFLELSRRSSSTRTTTQPLSKSKKTSTWLFSLSLCCKLGSSDEVNMKTATFTPSLGYLLEAERRASSRF